DDRDRPAVAAAAELRHAVADGEDRVVLADRRPRARAEPRAALADDDLAGADVLPREDLDAEELRIRVAAVLPRAHALLVGHLVLLFLCQSRLERRDRALARRVLVLVGERRVELLLRPVCRRRLDPCDGQLLVARRDARRRWGCRRSRLGVRLRRLLRSRRALRPGAERDLDARGRRAVAVVALVAGAAAVRADPDLRAALVRDHGRRDRAVAEQHVGLEALAGLRAEAVDDERLTVVDAVLLVAKPDDRVTVSHLF